MSVRRCPDEHLNGLDFLRGNFSISCLFAEVGERLDRGLHHPRLYERLDELGALRGYVLAAVESESYDIQTAVCSVAVHSKCKKLRSRNVELKNRSTDAILIRESESFIPTDVRFLHGRAEFLEVCECQCVEFSRSFSVIERPRTTRGVVKADRERVPVAALLCILSSYGEDFHRLGEALRIRKHERLGHARVHVRFGICVIAEDLRALSGNGEHGVKVSEFAMYESFHEVGLRRITSEAADLAENLPRALRGIQSQRKLTCVPESVRVFLPCKPAEEVVIVRARNVYLLRVLDHDGCALASLSRILKQVVSN